MTARLLTREWSGLAIAAALGVAGLAVARLVPSAAVTGVVLVAVAAGLGIGALRHLAAVAAVARRHPPPGRRVDVGGYALHVFAEGDATGGRPAVVWFGGGHASGASMSHLHRDLRARTRSILVDRPGTGWSDTGPFPCTTAGEAEACWRALDAAGERGPFVLVGHSFGGLLAANMARRRRQDVAAVVLLDATPPDTIVYGPRLGALREMRRGTWWAGALRLFGLHDSPFERAQRRQAPEVFALGDRVLGEAGAVDRALGVKAGHWFATASIFAELGPVGLAERAWDVATYDGDLDGLLVVLVAPGDSPEVEALADVRSAADDDARRMVRLIARTRERYLAVSDRSRRVVTPPGTAHVFPLQVPAFVVEVVSGVVDECATQ